MTSTAPVLQIVAICGSLRQDSFNRRLLVAAQALCPPGMTITINDDLRALPLLDEDLENEAGEGPPVVQRFKQAVAAADGLLIATPEYNNSIPGVLKNALDWLSRGNPAALPDKPVAVIGATTGMWGTRLSQAALRQVLYATEALVMPRPSTFVRTADKSFDAGGALADPRLQASLEKMLPQFALWIARVRQD